MRSWYGIVRFHAFSALSVWEHVCTLRRKITFARSQKLATQKAQWVLLYVLNVVQGLAHKVVFFFSLVPLPPPPPSSCILSCKLHLSLNRWGRWGTTDNFTTSFLHFSPFSTALWDLANSRPVYILMLSSTLFFRLPWLLTPFHCALQNDFGQTWWTGDMSIPLQFASLYDGQKVFVWSDCLLDLGTDFLVSNMVFAWDALLWLVICSCSEFLSTDNRLKSDWRLQRWVLSSAQRQPTESWVKTAEKKKKKKRRKNKRRCTHQYSETN